MMDRFEPDGRYGLVAIWPRSPAYIHDKVHLLELLKVQVAAFSPFGRLVAILRVCYRSRR